MSDYDIIRIISHIFPLGTLSHEEEALLSHLRARYLGPEAAHHLDMAEALA